MHAAWKRRAPSQTPGVWAGALCKSIGGVGLFVTCSLEKWNKGRKMVLKWSDMVLTQGLEVLFHNELEKDVSYLVHLSRTFPSIFPYSCHLIGRTSYT